MPTEVFMPQLGESVIEGTITKWLKKPGDKVEEYEPLLEVNTDKVDSEIPSPASGIVLEILEKEGATVNAGTVLAWIGKPGEDIAPANGPQAPEQPMTEPALAEKPVQPGNSAAGPSAVPAAGRDRDLGFISPVVARMASEHQVDLYQIQGSGQGGRITKRDVMAYLDARAQGSDQALRAAGAAAPAAPAQPSPQPAPAAAPAPAPMPAPALEPASGGEAPGEILPLTAVRRAIAEHMVLSKRTSPHVTTIMEADLSRVVAHREANKTAYQRDGVNLTYTAYFVSAIVAAIKAYPIVNSSWVDEGVLQHRGIHIGMATSLGESGLIVPVIKNADSYSLLGLARTVNDLANRARARQLKPDEVKGGTFTITNHGTSGSLFATPIINQPQCGILGVGAIQKRVVVVSVDGADSIAIRPMVYLGLTFDHRILDGAIADYFLGKVVESLEKWG
jgi:2-oxoglutarate dehydrogenase E2 component (dihydrolipoamide succinyltransferase)